MPIILSITAAFAITFILLPIVIKVSKSIDLLDAPDNRKIHSVSTPTIGGVAIFLGFMVASTMTIPFHELVSMKYLLFGLMITFIMGLRDDIASLLAKQKLYAQIFAAFLIVFFAGIRLDGFYGIFGIYNMPDWFDISMSIFVIVALTNSFNLIDGIDGLAGSIAIIILSFFGIAFYYTGDTHLSILSFSVVGSVVAFLFYNWHPSKVFMGDTGSMILGFIVSTLSIEFINKGASTSIPYINPESTVAVAVAVMIVPVFDTLRVFSIRFISKKNPLDPDRNHLHHGLLKIGFNHSQATILLILCNLSVITFAIALNSFVYNGVLFLMVILFSMILSSILEIKLMKQKFIGHQERLLANKDVYISKSA